MKSRQIGQDQTDADSVFFQVNQARIEAEQSQDTLNAFTSIRNEEDIRGEIEVITTPSMVKESGPLWGTPISVKDSFHVQGLPRWHGSASHKGELSETDSIPVQRLRKAGAIIIGKTTMPDYGLVASGVSSEFGITRNPWNNSFSPGGSSSGAGASVAGTSVKLALGTDIAGSVRLPAAHCGITALKPTQGAIAHTPASTWRSAGPMARTVKETRDLFAVLMGSHPADHLSMPSLPMASNVSHNSDRPLQGMKLGVIEWPGYGPEMDAATAGAFQQVISLLSDLGASLVTASPGLTLEDFEALDRCLMARALAEFSACPGDLQEKLLHEVRTWFTVPTAQSAHGYYSDFEHLSSVASRLSVHFKEFDFLISPVMGDHCFAAEDFGPDTSKPLLYHTNFTAWFNQTGQPALTLPMAISGSGLPVGLQIAGPRFADFDLLNLGELLESHLQVQLNYPTHHVQE